MPLLSVLPIIVPLVGALVCLIQKRLAKPVPIRALHVVVLALTALALIGARMYDAGTMASVAAQDSYLTVPAAPLWTPLSLWAGVMLIGVLLGSQLADLGRPMQQARCMMLLISLAASMAIISAGNVISLMLAWPVPLWLALYMRVSSSDSEAEQVSRWDIWAGWASVGLVMLGAVALAAEQEGMLTFTAIGPGLAFAALGLAAGLRLFLWPLAGSTGRWWQLHVMSLVTGVYLWLRLGTALIVDAAPFFPPSSGLAMAALLVLGVLIGPRDDRTSRLPRGSGYWLVLSMLAPLLDPGRGFAVSLLVATQGLLSLLALHLYTVPRRHTRLAQSSRIVARAALYGLPFTSGFAAHWLFAQICLRTGNPMLLIVASLAYLAVIVPFWGRLPAFRDELFGMSLGLPQRWTTWLLTIPAVLLLVLGLWPGLLDALWPDIRLGLEALHYGQMLGGSARELISLLVATLIIPMGGSLLLSLKADWLLEIGRQVVDRARQSVSPGSLYLLAEQVVERTLAATRRGLENLEEALPLGWTLLWTLALIYYLVIR